MIVNNVAWLPQKVKNNKNLQPILPPPTLTLVLGHLTNRKLKKYKSIMHPYNASKKHLIINIYCTQAHDILVRAGRQGQRRGWAVGDMVGIWRQRNYVTNDENMLKFKCFEERMRKT